MNQVTSKSGETCQHCMAIEFSEDGTKVKRERELHVLPKGWVILQQKPREWCWINESGNIAIDGCSKRRKHRGNPFRTKYAMLSWLNLHEVLLYDWRQAGLCCFIGIDKTFAHLATQESVCDIETSLTPSLRKSEPNKLNRKERCTRKHESTLRTAWEER